MSKQTGLGQVFLIDGYNLSGDVGSIDECAGGHGLLDVTGVNKSAVERILAMRDGRMGFSAWWNTTALYSYAALTALPTTDRNITWALGTTRGNPAACLVAKQIDLAATRGTDGGLGMKVTAQANGYGLDWGHQLSTGVETITSAANGTAVDLTTASTDFGAIAFLQVTAFTGTSCTFHIEDSNTGSSNWVDVAGLAFSAASGRTSQRVASTSATANIRQYVRFVSAGTFSSCTFHMAIIRPSVALT